MTVAEAVQRLEVVLAHAWMVRTYLKHADEIQENEEFLEVPRTIFDYCRAVEAARDRGDSAEFLRRIRDKFYKLRRVADFFAAEFRQVSDHTNYHMAALSLSGCVRQIEEILAAVEKTSDSGTDPL
jgi:hypothetical protein